MIFCFFFLINLLIFYRIAQKLMGLKFLNFFFGNFLTDLFFRLSPIFFIMLHFRYLDEDMPDEIPYRKNKDLYFTFLLISAIQSLTYYYVLCFKLKKDKLSKIIFIAIVLLGKIFLDNKLIK